MPVQPDRATGKARTHLKKVDQGSGQGVGRRKSAAYRGVIVCEHFEPTRNAAKGRQTYFSDGFYIVYAVLHVGQASTDSTDLLLWIGNNGTKKRQKWLIHFTSSKIWAQPHFGQCFSRTTPP
jgi:hypothetical protein